MNAEQQPPSPTTITLRLDGDLYLAVKTAAEALDQNVSEVIRSALKSHLRNLASDPGFIESVERQAAKKQTILLQYERPT